MDFDAIIEQFFSNLPENIPADFLSVVKENSHIRVLKKGEVLLEEFSQNQNAFFIIKGSFVRYIVTPRGEERAIMFHTEEFVPAIGSVHIRSENSAVNYLIKANEESTVMEVNIAIRDYITACKPYMDFASKNILQVFSVQNQIQNHLLGLSTEDFYHWLVREHRFILQRFPAKDIANFMGVSPTWLSLLKKKSLLENG